MTSGWECVDFGVFMGLVSLLHNYEWSIFGAVLLGLGELTGRGPAQLQTGLQEMPQNCRTVGEGDGKGREGNRVSFSH